MDNSDSFSNILEEINKRKKALTKQCTVKSTFIEDSGIRVVPTYQDKSGVSVFYAGEIKRIGTDEKNKD